MVDEAVRGGRDDDVLIGAATSFDADLDALDSLLARWNSGHDYTDRVAEYFRALSEAEARIP